MEKPILFSTKMVQAILEGRKTQTRRVIKLNLVKPKWTGDRWVESGCDDTKHFEIKCPYGKKGDLLWVRETWNLWDVTYYDQAIIYKADMEHKNYTGKWKPSIHMPKEYARLWLEVLDVRVERVQEITNRDIESEGACTYGCTTHRLNFEQLWDSINEKRGFGWDVNPWVWVVDFKSIDKLT